MDAEVLTVARAVLDHAITGADHVGIAVLSRLTADTGPAGRAAADRALAAWLRGFRGGSAGAHHSHRGGLFYGAAGLLAGLEYAAELDPRLGPAAARVMASLISWARGRPWRTGDVATDDYDLVQGPAGLVLALTASRHCPAEAALLTARHLTGLCGADLSGFRIGVDDGDPMLRHHRGRINTGLAHGVAGVVAALRAACEIDPPGLGWDFSAPARNGTAPQPPAELTVSLRTLCRWLVSEAYTDGRGVITWWPMSRDGGAPPAQAARPQAWCYGTPGIAWPLWDAGRILADPELQQFAAEAMASFCRAFRAEDGLHARGSPGEALAICHGAAGLLAIADAFDRHAGLAEAAAVAGRLEDYLMARLSEAEALAAASTGLQAGAAGVLAALLTRQGGDRRWLRLIALR